jgi:hypothetical protein
MAKREWREQERESSFFAFPLARIATPFEQE